MSKMVALIRWLVRDFGPLLVFYGTNVAFGFVPAVLTTIAWTTVEVGLLLWRKQPISGFLTFSATVTVGFGLIDLVFQSPVLLRYESVVTNLFTGAFFGLSLRAKKSFIQEAAERRAELQGKPMTLTPVVLAYFRGCTIVWTAYFFLKAAVYAWVNTTYDFNAALALRVLIGNVTFYPLMGASIFLAKPIIAVMKRREQAKSPQAEPSA